VKDLMRRQIAKTPALARKSHGGRPSQEVSARLTEDIVDRATALFLRVGFEAVSIDTIAAEAAISKRTLYSRFGGKADLFTAVVVRYAEKHMVKLDIISAHPGPLKRQLENFAKTLIQIACQPEAVALDRVVTAEVGRFPELGRILYDFAGARALGLVEKILDQAHANGEISIRDRKHAAEHFFHAVIVGPMRLVTLGVEKPELTSSHLKRLRLSIDLFLNGVRPRNG
jgi:AcrR family transcriptional regulator